MSNELTPIEHFNQGFASQRNQETLKKYLATEDLQDRFTAVVTRAVQEKPELLEADRKTLFYACQRAAQDKLMPDGREGFLNVYNTNVGTRDDPDWIQKVQWQPMIYGLHKILGEHGYSLTSELIYKNDYFKQHKGDDPRIDHEPTPINEERGEMIGAYAIATEKATGYKTREIMNLAELRQVREASKNPNGNVWQKWEGQMYRKAPAKRLFNRLALPESFTQVIDRDNEQFDLNKAPAVSDVAKSVQEHVRLAKPDPEVKVETKIPQDTSAELVEARDTDGKNQDRPVDAVAESAGLHQEESNEPQPNNPDF